MDLVEIMRDSVKTLWRRKSLWLFGLFVVGSGSGGGSNSGVDPASAGTGAGLGGLPGWVVPLVIAAVVVGIAGLIMHVISEGALIEGVARSRDGEEFSLGDGFRAGWSHVGVLFRIKALFLLVALLSGALLASPAILYELELISQLAAALLAVPAVLIGIPWLLTLYIVYSFALRCAVLENRHALDAIRRARLFLHQRLLAGLKLILANAVGQIGMGLALCLCALPAALFAGAGYLTGDLVGAAIGGSVVFLPLLVAVTGAHGTYQSSIWTLGFLAESEA